MFVNELILRLKKLVDEHGDLEIYMESDEDEGFWPVTHTRLVHLLNMHDVAIRNVIGICGSEVVFRSINSERIKNGIAPTEGG